jgi:hypothetical protein
MADVDTALRATFEVVFDAMPAYRADSGPGAPL